MFSGYLYTKAAILCDQNGEFSLVFFDCVFVYIWDTRFDIMATNFLNTEEALEIILRDGSDLEEKMSEEEVDSGG